MLFDEDKVRRNLVVASTTVIASHYLGLPINEIIINKLLGEGYKVDKLHLTQLGFAVFVYLGLMFRFSELGKSYTQKVAEDSAKLAEARSIRWGRRAISLYLAKGTRPRLLIKPSVVKGFASALKTRPRDASGFPNQIHVYPIDRQNQLFYPYLYTANVNIKWKPALINENNDAAAQVEVELTKFGRILLRALTFLERHLYTETATQTLIPVILGNIAVGCIAFKIISPFFSAA